MPTVAAIAAVAFFVAGVVLWRMASPNLHVTSPYHHAVPSALLPHRLHPLRAELLWAASAVLALVAVGTGSRQWRRPQTVTGNGAGRTSTS
jgi:hypothetical protein